MPELSGGVGPLALTQWLAVWASNAWIFALVLIGFSIVIFVHELGHFLAAKWMGIRVDRFAIGFFRRVVGYRRGEGLTFGKRDHSPEEIAARGWGETDYCLNLLPFGGYVKMLGQDDVVINEDTGEVQMSTDPRSFANKSVGRRMLVVSGGVIGNLAFAVPVLMLVFLVGKDLPAPCLGLIEPGSPAAQAGLLPGDRVLNVDGSTVTSFDDVAMAWVLSGGNPVRLKVARDGATFDLTVDHVTRGDRMGISPLFTGEVEKTDFKGAEADGLRPGDRITHVNGVAVRNALEIPSAFEASDGQPVTLTVSRPSAGRQPATTLTVVREPRLLISPPGAGDAQGRDGQHLLGLMRRQRIAGVVPGTPAEKVGFAAGDVVVQWGSVANPVFADISENIRANEGRPVAVVVQRGPEQVTLHVTPRSPFRLFGNAQPTVGLAFEPEHEPPVVADVAAGTPAAALALPRGAELLAVNGQAVASWPDVYEALRAAAGRSVEVRYRSGADEQTGRMSVPPSIVSALDLPPAAIILRIDGQQAVTLESGRQVRLPSPVAVRGLLEKNIGRTVSVEYVSGPLDAEVKAASFAVTRENADPWPLRVQYGLGDRLVLRPLMDRVSAHGNPLLAMKMGAEHTGRFLLGLYRTLQRMVTRDVSVENVAGPVGIFDVAMQQAKSGLADLLFFLAFISVNLAVLNFLPLPVVDGGLMLFLIIEKIRGKPLNWKIQMATTLTGLVLIVLTFLFVTIQDLTRLLGS